MNDMFYYAGIVFSVIFFVLSVILFITEKIPKVILFYLKGDASKNFQIDDLDTNYQSAEYVKSQTANQSQSSNQSQTIYTNQNDEDNEGDETVILSNDKLNY